MASRFSLDLVTAGGTVLHLNFFGDPWALVAGAGVSACVIGAVVIFTRGRDGPGGDEQLALIRQQQALNRQQRALMQQQQVIMHQPAIENDNRPQQFVHNDFDHE